MKIIKEKIKDLKAEISGNKIVVFTAIWCKNCKEAKKRLEEGGWASQTKVIDLDHNLTKEQKKELDEMTGILVAPKIFVDGKYIGSLDKFSEWLQNNKRN